MLFSAVSDGDSAMAAWLLEHDADQNINRGVSTVLETAIGCGHCEIIEMLAAHGADLNGRSWDDPCYTPLECALAYGQCKAARTLIRLGARLTDNCMDQAICGIGGDVDCIRLVVECGGDVHSVNDDNWTPLGVAAYKGNVDVARVLVASGAPVNPQQGKLPVVIAIKEQNADMVRYLIGQNAIVPPEYRDALDGLIG